MSVKDCGNHGRHELRKLCRCIFGCVFGFVVLVLFVILVIWLVLRPTKPKFFLQDLTVYQFNLTGPNLLTTTVQVTVTSHNPNGRIGVYYDKLDAYVEYQNQQITIPTAFPPGYQGHDDVTIWSPYLYGAFVPVAPYVAMSFGQDETAGYVLLYLKVEGHLRWKVGSWISGRYHIDVSCPAFLTVGTDGTGFRFQQITACTVDV